jgi:DNA segregation ATPase FtsK/SpoIIIE-like protein
MLDPRITFKNRYFAGVLALLLPGAGHVYQGRYFKGILCGACVLVTFFYGMALGDWSVVYWKRDPTNFLNPYYAQAFVGLPAFPSLVQARRYDSRTNIDEMSISAPIDAPFHGTLRIHDRTSGLADGMVDGKISLQPSTRPAEGRVVQGTFTGQVDKKEVTLKLGMPKLGKAVSADPDRDLEVDVVDASDPPQTIGRLRGAFPRRFLDRFEAPPDEKYYLDLNGKLGKFHELAMTFTMIAGLLNILVILDAVEGPAYGYGDGGEQERRSDAGREKTDKTVPPAQPPPADAPKKAQELAEKKAQEAAEKKAQELAEKKAQETAEKKAQELAEKKAQEVAEKKAQELAEKKAQEAAEKKAQELAEKKTQEAAEKK